MTDAPNFEQFGISDNPVLSLENIADTDPQTFKDKEEVERVEDIVDAVATKGGAAALKALGEYLEARVAQQQELKAKSDSHPELPEGMSHAELRSLVDKTDKSLMRLETVFNYATGYIDKKLDSLGA